MRLSNYVGNTPPLIPIRLGKYTVWGKCEFMNPGGSVKDRMATYIINDAEDRHLIKKGDTNRSNFRQHRNCFCNVSS